MRHSTFYTVLFATAISLVCGVLVSSAAVTLYDRQQVNKALDRQRNVLEAAGLVEAGQKVSSEEVQELFSSIEPRILDLRTGEFDPNIDFESWDYRKAAQDPATSFPAPPNRSGISSLPTHVPVYLVRNDAGEIRLVVLPIHGLGLWSTLYGFLAIDADGNTVDGITYYEHGETPGLGGEVENPRWKALWPGRKIYDDQGTVALSVIKGQAGDVASDPYHVDGLSGATITSRGVTEMIHFWLGPDLYGKFLENLKSGTLDGGAAPPQQHSSEA